MQNPNNSRALGERPGQRLKVGVVTETYLPEINGVARTLSRLIRNLEKKGHSVHMVRPQQGRRDVGDCHSIDTTTLVQGIPIPWYRSLRAGWPSFMKLFRVWRRHPPDVIYVATEGPLGLAAVLAAKKLDIPVISGFHTNFPSYSLYYRLGFLEPLIMGYLRYFHNRTASTLVPTYELKEQLTDKRFIGVDVVGRGVDLELFSPHKRCNDLRRSWGVENDEPVVLYVGRLATEKNIELALQAYDRMRQTKTDLRFVLVGDGPVREELASHRDDLIFAGEHTGESLARYYASADIFLFPSETETFGNVTLEALASGLALVAFDYAAAREVGHHGRNGLYVPLREYEQFITAAVTLAEDSQQIDDLKINARETTLSCDWQTIFDRFESLLFKHQKRDYFGAPLPETAGR